LVAWCGAAPASTAKARYGSAARNDASGRSSSFGSAICTRSFSPTTSRRAGSKACVVVEFVSSFDLTPVSSQLKKSGIIKNDSAALSAGESSHSRTTASGGSLTPCRCNISREVTRMRLTRTTSGRWSISIATTRQPAMFPRQKVIHIDP
jgi:hypothetical protein